MLVSSLISKKKRLSFRRASGIICDVNAILPMPRSPAKPLVYLETSFISYLTAPVSSDEAVARRQAATHKWWEEERPKCDVMVSFEVWREISDGNREKAMARKAILRDIPSVPSTAEASRLSALLMEAHALPLNSLTDALHIALAAVYGADILLTWNCRHIANPITLPKTVETIAFAGYRCPALATPVQLLEARNEGSPA